MSAWKRPFVIGVHTSGQNLKTRASGRLKHPLFYALLFCLLSSRAKYASLRFLASRFASSSRQTPRPILKPKIKLKVRCARLGAFGFGHCCRHRFEQGDHECGFTAQGDKLICLVHAGRWNRVRARVGSDNGLCRKRLVFGSSRQGDRRNQNAERSRACINRHLSRHTD